MKGQSGDSIIAAAPGLNDQGNGHLLATSPVKVHVLAPETLKQIQQQISSIAKGGPSNQGVKLDGIVGKVISAFNEYKKSHAGKSTWCLKTALKHKQRPTF